MLIKDINWEKKALFFNINNNLLKYYSRDKEANNLYHSLSIIVDCVINEKNFNKYKKDYLFMLNDYTDSRPINNLIELKISFNDFQNSMFNIIKQNNLLNFILGNKNLSAINKMSLIKKLLPFIENKKIFNLLLNDEVIQNKKENNIFNSSITNCLTLISNQEALEHLKIIELTANSIGIDISKSEFSYGKDIINLSFATQKEMVANYFLNKYDNLNLEKISKSKSKKNNNPLITNLDIILESYSLRSISSAYFFEKLDFKKYIAEIINFVNQNNENKIYLSTISHSIIGKQYDKLDDLIDEVKITLNIFGAASKKNIDKNFIAILKNKSILENNTLFNYFISYYLSYSKYINNNDILLINDQILDTLLVNKNIFINNNNFQQLSSCNKEEFFKLESYLQKEQINKNIFEQQSNNIFKKFSLNKI